jgi:glycerophosphoryl diester phosphodiesterase
MKRIYLFLLSLASAWILAFPLAAEDVTAPVADILDVVFRQDGTAEDVSAMQHTVQRFDGAAVSTYYNDTYRRYVARFVTNSPGTASSGYYWMNYTNDTDMKNKLADGYTLEALIMSDIAEPFPNQEIKAFSSTSSGGTAIMLGDASKGNNIVFIIHNGNWVFVNSGIRPVQKQYYHVTGVWDKEAGKAHIYVDGVLKATQNAPGNFTYPTALNFTVGGNINNGAGQAAWKGEVVLSRVYDRPLTATEVTALWNQVKDATPGADAIDVTGVSLPCNLFISPGSACVIQGNGFLEGDSVRFQPLTGEGETFTCPATLQPNGLTVALPTTLTEGRYRLILLRGNRTKDLGYTNALILRTVPKIIAHRGYWDTPGSAQNSVAALQKAQELGIYGSEFDVYITTDDQLVLNHDATINGFTIENSTYDQLKNITLSNGEPLPTLNDYLQQGKQDANTKLILEIKTHSNSANNLRAAAASVAAVAAAGMTEQVEYISFGLDICSEVVRLQPNAKVAYLLEDRTPQFLHDRGINGIDFYITVLRNHPNYITEAHQLGMTVNVWTVNSESDLIEMALAGVDYITTDQPLAARNLFPVATATEVVRPRVPETDVTVTYRSGEITVSNAAIKQVFAYDLQGRLLHANAHIDAAVYSFNGNRLPAISIVKVVTENETKCVKVVK